MSRANGSIIGPVNAPTSSEAKGVWSLDEQYEAQRAGTWPPTINQYQISRSLRFNSADSAYLNRTLSTPTDGSTWTVSVWVKRSSITGNYQYIFSYGAVGNTASRGLAFDGTGGSSTDSLYLYNGTASIYSTPRYRDPSAWYHVVVSCSAGTANVYVNNSASVITTTMPAMVNTTVFDIGRWMGGPNFYLSGYLADFHFIDGQALTPSSFGQTNSTTGVWEPIAYTGTYGTNGFYLNFSDNSGTTSTTLGKDYSGNGNNLTPNNFSVTAGVGNDSLVDTPTSYGTDTGAGGEVRGNYATLNPVNKGTSTTVFNGNLEFTSTSTGNDCRVLSTIGMSSGKWYCEYIPTDTSTLPVVGIAISTEGPNDGYLGQTIGSYGYYALSGRKYNNGVNTAYGAAYGLGDVVGIAYDADAGTLTFYKNGVSQGVAFTSIPAGTYYFGQGDQSATFSGAFNFGQRPFAYAAPSGFKALCTQNLPTPTVAQGDDYFNTVTYSGTGANSTAITGVGFQPDLVWIKVRSTLGSHYVVDAVRGLGTGDSMRVLDTAASDAEYASENDQLRSFNSDGFTLDSNSPDASFYVNRSGDTYVSWNWNAGGSTVTNTAGSISSQVRANPTAGFSIVSWTYGGAATIGHGLNAVPKMMIVKGRNAVYNWDVYHASTGPTGRLVLNSTAAFATNSGPWNNTAPTSTVFSQGPAWYNNGDSLIGYIFAEVPGYSAFGSYTGNGSTDGPFIYTGFKPAFVLTKAATASADGRWLIRDDARNTYNPVVNALYPNYSNAEDSTPNYWSVDFCSNGFKTRVSDTVTNQSGVTYIYMAFAENPFKYALAR